MGREIKGCLWRFHGELLLQYAGEAQITVAPTHDVVGLPVLDCDRDGLIKHLEQQLSSAKPERAVIATAVHIEALLHRRDAAFVASVRAADVVYADGNAVVLAARAGGAQQIKRCVTTDIGWDFIALMAVRLGRPVRLAAIGGPNGLAEVAIEAIRLASEIVPVFVTHGYHGKWDVVVRELASARPDVILVGLGCPREAVWSAEHAGKLGGALIVTCGGWFGYLANQEQRAPAVWRRTGLEWLYRLLQDPRRLGPRYLRGLAVLPPVMVAELLTRRRQNPL